MVLVAICDAHCRLSMVDIGVASANHDTAIFKASKLGNLCFSQKL